MTETAQLRERYIQGAAERILRFRKLIKTIPSKIIFFKSSIVYIMQILKNYITQVAAFIVDTLIEPLAVLFHDPAGHFGRNGNNFLGYRLRKTVQSLGTMLVYPGIQVASKKNKWQEVKSGERGGHPLSPRKETTCPGNISLRIPSERRDVWAVAPSS
jgi:hypothetical protein